MTTTQQELLDTKYLAIRTQQRARRIASGETLTTFTKKPYTRESVLESYHRHGDIKMVCTETGCTPYNAYIIVQCAGMLRGADRQSYGSVQQISGRAAEDEFKRLVPDAMDMNIQYQMNHPGYDFDLRGLKIDVKFSTLQGTGKRQNKNWCFYIERSEAKYRKTPKNEPDFFVLFATDGQCIKDGYRTFLFPRAIIAGTKSIRFQPDLPSRWHDFEIAPADLAVTLEDAATAMAGEVPA